MEIRMCFVCKAQDDPGGRKTARPEEVQKGECTFSGAVLMAQTHRG